MHFFEYEKAILNEISEKPMIHIVMQKDSHVGVPAGQTNWLVLGSISIVNFTIHISKKKN